jgi:2-polyprenyl-6-methoxyphenol hydroxylase-like FAD-dependent oxidoreductase
MDVLIVGAGIGGLTTALALKARGITAALIESARTIEPLGVGINLQPQAVEVLADLDLDDALAETALTPHRHLYTTRSGTEVWSEPRGLARGDRRPQYSLHRGELEMLLHDAVTDRLGHAAIATGKRAHDVTRMANTATVTVLDRVTHSTERIEADIVIGADGARSAASRALHPQRPMLHWSGVQTWRGITDRDRFGDGETMYIANGTDRSRLIAYPISRQATRAGHTLVNWVCLIPVEDEQRIDEGAAITTQASTHGILPHYADWVLAGIPVPALIAGARHIVRYPMVDRDPLPSWTDGRATLLGDAAHLMYPIGANGASQAIVDAAHIAEALSAHPDPSAALDQYESARRPATAAIIRANREMHTAERRAAPDDADALATIADRYRTTIEKTATR